MAKRSSTKAVLAWAWTQRRGTIVYVSLFSIVWQPGEFGGTRIRVRVTPVAKKAAKKRSGK